MQRSTRGLERILGLLAVVAAARGSTGAGESWQGLIDKNVALNTSAYDFGANGGGNENYYDGDFADFDGDGRMDRGLISRYGLLWNVGGGVLIPVSTQQRGQQPNSSASLTGYLFGDEVNIGNDAVQWADIDGDGDLDNIQGGNGEPFTVQTNRRGRFAVKRKYSGSALNIVSIDLERDGDVDFAAAHAFCSNARCGHGCPEKDCDGDIGAWPKSFKLWVNDGDGDFTDETAARGMGIGANLIVGVAAGDVDADGDFDLVVISGCSDGVVNGCATPGMVRGLGLARNDGAGFFSLEGIPLATEVRPIGDLTSGFSQGLNLGDVDDDGDLDIACALRRDLPPHPNVGHGIFINDGTGSFVEESASRFEVGTFDGLLMGGNGKLVDLDHDGDLDFLAFQRERNTLQLFMNDGSGTFTYDPVHSVVLPGEPTALGNDTDVSDIDGDGTYDVWVGSAATIVHPLINTHVAADGLPADMPRDPAIESMIGVVTLSFRAPSFAANVRHYRVYRSLAPGVALRDRRLQKTIANSVHEDEGFAAPITRHTTTEYLGDLEVELDGGLIRYTDAAVTPGMTYYYSIRHVGTENNASRPTAELAVTVGPPPPPEDTTGPELRIASPDSQWWSAHPRIVLEYGDAGSAVDPESLSVSFDAPLGTGDPATGGRAAGVNIADRFFRKDANAYVYALGETKALPQGLVTLAVSVADLAGNVTTGEVTFNVSVISEQPPLASFSASPDSGEAPLEVTFSSQGSTDTGGVILRREWYFPGGREAIGPDATFIFQTPGVHEVALLVRDNDGGVSIATRTVEVTGLPRDFRRGDSSCDGEIAISDAIRVLDRIFLRGPALCCAEAADSNDDARIDVSDPVHVLLWLFVGGNAPAAPGPFDCGPDPEPESGLGCVAYAEERCGG